MDLSLAQRAVPAPAPVQPNNANPDNLAIRAQVVQYFDRADLNAVLNILCSAESVRIVDSVWIMYFLSRVETIGNRFLNLKI